MIQLYGIIYVWIYEHDAQEFDPYHPYFTLISRNFYAAFKPSKQAKSREGGQWKEDKQVKKEKKTTDFPF